MHKKLNIIILLTVLSMAGYVQDVENDMQYRTALELNYKIVKGLKLDIIPQIRFDEEFSVNRYLLEGGLTYKTFDFLYWEGTYRLIVKPQEYLESETFSKYGFSLTAKKRFADFTPSFRFRYSNYADDDVTDKEFLRYKAKVKYDIPNCKITPFVALEAFHDLGESNLYKMRYSTGVAYKVKKNNYIKLNYRLDYYQQEYRNKHIIGVAYKYNF